MAKNASSAARTPVTLEGPGRYKVVQAPGGDWVIARSVDICETCRECGCGEQAEPVRIPAMVIQMAKRAGQKKMFAQLGISVT